MSDRDANHVWELVEKISFCMLATWDGSEIHARPMSPSFERSANSILFLTDARNQKDEEIEAYPRVTLIFSDPSAQKYVSLIGKAEVSNDRATIRRIWSVPARAWWDSPEDPNIRLLKVSPTAAEYWDSPGTVVSYVKMALAAVSGTRPAVGENEKTSM